MIPACVYSNREVFDRLSPASFAAILRFAPCRRSSTYLTVFPLTSLPFLARFAALLAANAAFAALADEAKRQRQAQALIGIGSAISSLGATPSSSSLSPIAPLSSGSCKTCRYRVGGEIVGSTSGRAELCPATRSIGGQTGYLVR